jgi:hypothetical protein
MSFFFHFFKSACLPLQLVNRGRRLDHNCPWSSIYKMAKWKTPVTATERLLGNPASISGLDTP